MSRTCSSVRSSRTSPLSCAATKSVRPAARTLARLLSRSVCSSDSRAMSSLLAKNSVKRRSHAVRTAPGVSSTIVSNATQRDRRRAGRLRLEGRRWRPRRTAPRGRRRQAACGPRQRVRRPARRHRRRERGRRRRAGRGARRTPRRARQQRRGHRRNATDTHHRRPRARARGRGDTSVIGVNPRHQRDAAVAAPLGVAADRERVQQRRLAHAAGHSRVRHGPDRRRVLTVEVVPQRRHDPVRQGAAGHERPRQRGCSGFVATDLDNFRGVRTTEQGAAIAIQLATLPDDGPIGGFFDDAGVVPW